MELSTVARATLARLAARPAPISLTYEVTHRCNLACRYCDRHTALPREMDHNAIFAVLEEFVQLGTRYVSLDGGEPLLHPDIHDIVELLVDRGVTVVMNSNGILVPKRLPTVRLLSRLKISFDGPSQQHDAMRGRGAHRRAVAGVRAAQGAGIQVELTCTVGQHNHDLVDRIVAQAESLGAPVIFQPVGHSLFLGSSRDGSAFVPRPLEARRALARVERLKRRFRAVANGWSSLRHFRRYPEDTALPCAAGWVSATLDPEGTLFPCDQVNRDQRQNNAVRLGVRDAFARLDRRGCPQCWCARIVEGNYTWGLRLDRMVPPRISWLPSWPPFWPGA